METDKMCLVVVKVLYFVSFRLAWDAQHYNTNKIQHKTDVEQDENKNKQKKSFCFFDCIRIFLPTIQLTQHFRSKWSSNTYKQTSQAVSPKYIIW